MCSLMPSGSDATFALAVAAGRKILDDPNADAAAKGLQKGDIITAVNGKSVKSEGDLSAVLSRLTAGDSLRISYLRKSGFSYAQKETTATLTLRP